MKNVVDPENEFWKVNLAALLVLGLLPGLLVSLRTDQGFYNNLLLKFGGDYSAFYSRR